MPARGAGFAVPECPWPEVGAHGEVCGKATSPGLVHCPAEQPDGETVRQSDSDVSSQLDLRSGLPLRSGLLLHRDLLRIGFLLWW